MSDVSAVVAYDKNLAIGLEGEMPWRGQLPEDMRHFRETTMGGLVVMGRVTFDSIGQPLPGRDNIVLSRQEGLEIPGCQVVGSIEEALEYHTTERETFIIGGSRIYSLAMPHINKLHVTEVDAEFDADTFFVDIDQNEWEEVAREDYPADDKNAYNLSFVTYNRKGSKKMLLPEATRTEEQRLFYQEILESGLCPFCPEHYGKFERQKEVIYEGEHWYLIPNADGYKRTKLHLVAVLNRHIDDFQELTEDEFAELLTIFQTAAKDEDIDFGAMAMRFGDPKETGASVRHLHAHLISPDPEQTTKEKAVKFRMSSKYD